MNASDAIRVLATHTSVHAAAAELAVSERHIRRVLKKAGHKPPTAYLQRERRVETVLVVPDAHAPYHDEQAVGVVMRAAQKLKPDTVVVLGDWIDNYTLSSFLRDPACQIGFDDELWIATQKLQDLKHAAGDARRVFCVGNHEIRLEKYVARNAPELHRILQLDKLLELSANGWEVVPYGESFNIGHLHFSHEFGRAGKYSAHQALTDTGHCTVFGHTHRAQLVYGGFASGERHVAASMGWLGRYDAVAFNYQRKSAAQRDWQHGFGWCEVETSTGLGWVQFIPILDGRARCNGDWI